MALMSNRLNPAAKRRFLAHYRRNGRVGEAGVHAGVSRRTASRWAAEIRAEVEAAEAEVREMVAGLVREAGDSLAVDLAPGGDSGCDVPPATRWQIVHQGTRTLGLDAPAKVDATVTHRRIEFVVRHEDDVVPDPPGREVAQRPETNGARLLT